MGSRTSESVSDTLSAGLPGWTQINDIRNHCHRCNLIHYRCHSCLATPGPCWVGSLCYFIHVAFICSISHSVACSVINYLGCCLRLRPYQVHPYIRRKIKYTRYCLLGTFRLFMGTLRSWLSRKFGCPLILRFLCLGSDPREVYSSKLSCLTNPRRSTMISFCLEFYSCAMNFDSLAQHFCLYSS